MADSQISVIDYKIEFALETVKMWRRSFQKAMGLEEQNNYDDLIGHLNFFSAIDPNNIRVAIDPNQSSIVGLLVQDACEIEHLYVHVDYQKRGIGSRLLNEAKGKSPECLELYTFQKNAYAPLFYRCQGFTEINRGYADDKSNPWATSKEDLADIRYRWQP